MVFGIIFGVSGCYGSRADSIHGQSYKNISIQNSKSRGHFYRYTQASLENNSNYQNFILTSGLKFNKSEIEVNLNKEESNCSILSALNISENEKAYIELPLHLKKVLNRAFVNGKIPPITYKMLNRRLGLLYLKSVKVKPLLVLFNMKTFDFLWFLRIKYLIRIFLTVGLECFLVKSYLYF